MFTFGKEFVGRYADFVGKTSKRDFWIATITYAIIVFILSIPYMFVGILASVNIPILSPILAALSVLLHIIPFLCISIFLVPTIAILVRRLRDAGFHWAFLFLIFTVIGVIAICIMLLMPSK